jgi:chromate reductase
MPIDRTIVAIPGSLRRGSLGRALLNAISDSLPEHVSMTILEAGDLPVYDADVVTEWSVRIKDIQNTVQAADGIIVSTPEYNGSYSGYVKNTIDWLSYGTNPFRGKPSVAVAVAGGVAGGADAVSHLLPVLMRLESPYMPSPRLNVPSAGSAFDDSLQLTDETVQRRIDSFVPAFLAWVERFAGTV